MEHTKKVVVTNKIIKNVCERNWETKQNFYFLIPQYSAPKTADCEIIDVNKDDVCKILKKKKERSEMKEIKTNKIVGKCEKREWEFEFGIFYMIDWMDGR